jgi:prophage tail gpP-like protein
MPSPWPTPGTTYTVQPGDTLRRISQKAYGDELLWPRIWRANTIPSGNPDLLIIGTSLFIPGEATSPARQAADSARFKSKDPLSFTLTLKGKEIPVSSSRVTRSLDSLADGCVCELPWTPGADSALDSLIKPYGYTPATWALGSTHVGTGFLYIVENAVDPDSIIKTLECFTGTVDLIDSVMAPNYAYEWDGASLRNIASQIGKDLGYGVKFNIPASLADAPYPLYVTIEKTTKYGDFLIHLAANLGILVGNDEYGNIVFSRVDSGAKPVGSLIEGDSNFRSGTGWKIKFDGRKRYHTYSVIPQSGDATEPPLSSYTDPGVPATRTMVYEGDDMDGGIATMNAKWRRNKTLVDALTFPFPVVGWYAPNGALWAPGQIVTIKSPSAHVNTGFNFLIREVEYVFEASGCYATLKLVPPSAYNGDEVINEPWGQS